MTANNMYINSIISLSFLQDHVVDFSAAEDSGYEEVQPRLTA